MGFSFQTAAHTSRSMRDFQTAEGTFLPGDTVTVRAGKDFTLTGGCIAGAVSTLAVAPTANQ